MILLERLALQYINKPLYRRKCRKKQPRGTIQFLVYITLKSFLAFQRKCSWHIYFFSARYDFENSTRQCLANLENRYHVARFSSHRLVPSIAKSILSCVFYFTGKEYQSVRFYNQFITFPCIKSNHAFFIRPKLVLENWRYLTIVNRSITKW